MVFVIDVLVVVFMIVLVIKVVVVVVEGGAVVAVFLAVKIVVVAVVVVVMVELNELAGRESNSCLLKSTEKAHLLPGNVLIVTLIQKSTWIIQLTCV